jgi:hypothetical protein
MSQEIQLSVLFNCVNGNFRDMVNPGPLTVDQAAIGRGGHVQVIGTSEEDFELGDVSTNGYAVFRNLDATNYVLFGPKSGGAMVTFCKLKPGEMAVMRIAPTVVIRGKADTAAIKLDIRVYED